MASPSHRRWRSPARRPLPCPYAIVRGPRLPSEFQMQGEELGVKQADDIFQYTSIYSAYETPRPEARGPLPCAHVGCIGDIQALDLGPFLAAVSYETGFHECARKGTARKSLGREMLELLAKWHATSLDRDCGPVLAEVAGAVYRNETRGSDAELAREPAIAHHRDAQHPGFNGKIASRQRPGPAQRIVDHLAIEGHE